MSLSFKIEGGDLKVGAGRSFETVTGADKLAQDLSLWILEHIGTDPATPQYGSALDGGTVNGVQIESFIGQALTDERVLEIKQELSTLLAQYQQDQVTKMQREMVLYNGNHTLTPDETLYSVDSIQAAVTADQIVVRISITTLAGASLKVTLPIGI
jgi:hypothetical protein